MADQVPGLDLERILPWFREHVEEVDSLTGEIIGHGRSNLTYRLRNNGRSWVLRRPPLSHVQATAHDMNREFTILTAIVDTDVPAPKPIAICDDEAVNDAQFYIMEYVDGLVPADPIEVKKRFAEEDRYRMGIELVDVLVGLHALVPEEIGLADWGKPQGYLERQVRRFAQQLESIRYRETEELDELARRLAKSIPDERRPGIVHGDYRLDNAILDDDGHIIAVLDWEMCTLGDSLADMGLLRMYWGESIGEEQLALAGAPVMTMSGFPSWAEARARYEEKSGADLSNLDFYTVLAHFKLGVILENMYKRFLGGGTVGTGFDAIGQQAFVLAKRGLAVANASEMAELRS
jgi:aminoglycoside phosphotransferase (APT) family kinase protein